MGSLLGGCTMWAVSLFLIVFGVQTSWAEPGSTWKAEWEKTLAAAHKEGRVSIYGQSRYPTSAAIKAFEKAYPKIKLNFMGGKGSQLGPRIMAEKRANKHLVDIAIGGAGTQVQVYYKARLVEPTSSAFILPEVKDESLWYKKRHHYADPERRFIFMMRGDVSASIGAYNTKIVKRGEIQSWWDLLDPKWGGKIVMTDPRARGNIGTWRFLYYNPELGPKFLRRLLSEMDIKFSVDERQMMDWVGSGKYPIHLLAKGANIDKAVSQGLPVRQFYSQKETGSITTGSAHISLFKNAPYPNAARVYINWALSRRGQLSWQNITKANSLRMDIPKDMLPPEVIPKPGKDYLMTSDPKYYDIKPLRKIAAEILGKSRRRR